MDGVEGRLQRHWRRCWQLTPEEKQWFRGTGTVTIARTAGFFLSTVAGTGIAVMAMDSLLRDHDAAAYGRLAEGMVFLLLGFLVQRGIRSASLGLMALFTVDRIIGNLIAYRHGSAYYADHPGFWLFIGLLAWATWIRVFWVAYRAERRQAAMDGLLSC